MHVQARVDLQPDKMIITSVARSRQRTHSLPIWIGHQACCTDTPLAFWPSTKRLQACLLLAELCVTHILPGLHTMQGQSSQSASRRLLCSCTGYRPPRHPKRAGLQAVRRGAPSSLARLAGGRSGWSEVGGGGGPPARSSLGAGPAMFSNAPAGLPELPTAVRPP